MGLFDFFKSKKVVGEAREVNLEKAKEIIKREAKEGREGLKVARKELLEKVNSFVLNIRERILVLNKIDLKEKREHERIKLLTLQGLKEYIIWLDRLVESLNKVKVDFGFDVDLYFRGIEISVNNFLKGSRGKLQRATILIGDELAVTEKIFMEFFKEVNGAIEENVSVFSKMKGVKKLEAEELELSKVKKTRKGIFDSVSKLEMEVARLVADRSDIENELYVFEKSKEYGSWMERKDGVRKEKVFMRKEIDRIKEIIGLKDLLKKFHGVESKWKLIGNYRRNFLEALEEDGELEIVNLLGENHRSEIGEAIRRARETHFRLKSETENYKSNEKKDEIKGKLKKADHIISETRKEVVDGKKLLDKFDRRIISFEEKVNEIVKEALEIGGEYRVVVGA